MTIIYNTWCSTPSEKIGHAVNSGLGLVTLCPLNMTFQIDWTKNQLIVCGPTPKSNDVYSFKLAIEVLTKSVSHDYITMMCKHRWLSEQLLSSIYKTKLQYS